MNLTFFGFQNCGKTTLGKIFAQRLNLPFVDTDSLIKELYSQRQSNKNFTVREIFQLEGASCFRTLESEALHTLEHIHHSIIAVGGGLILDLHHASFLSRISQLVYLKVDKEIIKKRTLSKELPAYLDPSNPEQSFEQIYRERQLKYEAIDALWINVENKTQEEILKELFHHLEQSHGK